MIIGALCSCSFLRFMDASGFGSAHPQWAMFFSILVAAFSGALFALLLAFALVNLKADQTIGGTALNMLARVCYRAHLGDSGSRANHDPHPHLVAHHAGNPWRSSEGEFLPGILFKSFYQTTIWAVFIFVIAAVVLYKTRFGLAPALRRTPASRDSVGVNVYRMRYAGVFISGLLGGIGGLAYTLAAGSAFQSTVAGYGFLALAVMIFGNWKLLNILGLSLFFALFKILGFYSGSIPFPSEIRRTSKPANTSISCCLTS
ncbi:MAG: ABC transporter permease [Eubacteriales bacterium]